MTSKKKPNRKSKGKANVLQKESKRKGKREIIRKAKEKAEGQAEAKVG